MVRVLSDEERTLYTQRLIQAEESRHLLLTGQSVEQFVDQNNEQIKYTKATISGLNAYIRELNELLNPNIKACTAPRPLRFVF